MIRTKIKSLATDTLTYGVFQTLGRFLTFLLTPLYSNYLTTNDNGVVAYLFAIIAISQYVYSFGMESAFFRFFEKNNNAHNKKIFSIAFFTLTTVSVLFTIPILLLSKQLSLVLLPDYPNAVHILQAAALIPFFDGLLAIPYARLRMLHQITRFATTRFAIIAFTVLLNVYFLMYTDFGAFGIFLAQLIASFVGFCIFLPNIISMLDFKLNKNIFINMIKFALPTLPANLSAVALQMIDRPIMKLYLDNSQVGIYQINAKLAVPMIMMVSIFDYAWKPFFLNHYKDNDAKPLFSRILTYFTFICMLVFLIVSLFLENIVRIPLWHDKHFIHHDYWNALYIVPVILIGYFFSGWSNNFAAVFHIEKKTKYLPIAISAAAVVSIVSNFILIPIIGFIGAAISLALGYFTSAFLMKYLQRKTAYKIDYEWKRICMILLVTAIIFTGGTYAKSIFSLEIAFWVKLILLILFGILLKIFGFFTASEINLLKRFLRIK